MTDPLYRTFDEYLAATKEAQRRSWCRSKATKANAPRLMSGAPDVKLTPDDVLSVLMDAKGRCAHCGSLAVENRPSNAEGHPLPWEAGGRRVGSLDHSDTRVGGGSNAKKNTRWSCLWCNTWPNQRIPGAIDHGGIQDGSLPAVEAGPARITKQQKSEFLAGYVKLSPEQRAALRERHALLRERQTPPEGRQDLDTLDVDRRAQITDPDDPDHLQGTTKGRDG